MAISGPYIRNIVCTEEAYCHTLSWKNSEIKDNIRDYASLNELLVLVHMKSCNVVLIGKGMR